MDKLLAHFAWTRLPAAIISVTTEAFRTGRNLVGVVQFAVGLACGALLCRVLVPLSGVLSVITTVIVMISVMMATALGFMLINVGGRLTTKKRVQLDEARRMLEEARDTLDKEASSLRASGMSTRQINEELLPRRRVVLDQYFAERQRIDGDDRALRALRAHVDSARSATRTASNTESSSHDVSRCGSAAGEESSHPGDELPT
ncbi:MAG: hypothetical protein AAGF11_16690 [Myxococcota bacterium]